MRESPSEVVEWRETMPWGDSLVLVSSSAIFCPERLPREKRSRRELREMDQSVCIRGRPVAPPKQQAPSADNDLPLCVCQLAWVEPEFLIIRKLQISHIRHHDATNCPLPLQEVLNRFKRGDPPEVNHWAADWALWCARGSETCQTEEGGASKMEKRAPRGLHQLWRSSTKAEKPLYKENTGVPGT